MFVFVFVFVLVFVLVLVVVLVLVPVLVLVFVLVLVPGGNANEVFDEDVLFVVVVVDVDPDVDPEVFVVVVALVVFNTVVSMVTVLLGYTTSPVGVTSVFELGPDPLKPPMTPRPNNRPKMSPANPKRASKAQQRGPQQVFLTVSS